MAEPQIQDQQNPDPITVHSGGAEGSPVSALPEQGVEPKIEHGPEFAPAQELDEQVTNAGVVTHSAQESVSSEAQTAGVSPSIPQDLSFKIPDFQTPAQAEEIVSKNPVTKGIVWQATEWLKNTLKLKKAA